MKKYIAAVTFCLGIYHQASSQEMWGAAHSNYAGQMGIELNPASIVAAPYKWEAHILSSDVSLTNNYIYLAKKSKLIKSGIEGQSVDEDRFQDKYTEQPDKYAYASTFLKYPAFIWSGKQLAFGFHASTRLELSAVDIPYHLAKFIKEGFDYRPQQKTDYQVTDADVVMMNWHEFALTGGMVLKNTSKKFITAAITAKYNYGLTGSYIQINDMSYQVPYDSVLTIYNLNGIYGHASPTEETGLSSYLKNRGNGFSADIGVQYYINRNDNFYNPCSRNKDIKPYDYKIGISLIDIGYIKYSTDAKTFQLEDVSTTWLGFDTIKFVGFNHSDTLLGNQFYGDPNGALTGNKFTVYTPAALSVQGDVAITSRFFVNASVIQRIPFSRFEIKRSNQISITPRYETRFFEFAIPFSYYDLFKPRLGVAFRVGMLTLGTDMLGPIVGITDTYGADFYFGISLKNFGTCGSTHNNGRRGKTRLEKCNTPDS